MKKNPFPTDDLGRLLRNLQRRAPRPGFEQRFWARAKAADSVHVPNFGRPPWRRWLPVAATVLGLMLGWAANRSLESERTTVGTAWETGLPAGSLAALFTIGEGR